MRHKQHQRSWLASTAVAITVFSWLLAAIATASAVASGPELRQAAAGARVVASASRCVLRHCWKSLVHPDAEGL